MNKSGLPRSYFLAAAAAAALTVRPRPGLASPSYARSVLAKRPSGFWRLGETAGPKAIDATGHGHDGTYRGSPGFGEAGAQRPDSDRAVRLDGMHDSVEVPDDDAWSQPTSSRGLTVEIWLRPDVLAFPGESAAKPYVHCIGKGEEGAFEWGVRLNTTGTGVPASRFSAFVWSPIGGLGAGAFFEDELTAGNWIHLVATFDPGNASNSTAGVRIYRDGILRGDPSKQTDARYATLGIVPAHGPAPLRLGSLDLRSFFAGAIDNAAIYPRVLSPAEIAENFRASGAIGKT